VKTENVLSRCDLVVLYFGAHWSPPCRLFTERLQSFYEQVNQAKMKIEIVFISDDGSKEAFSKNFSEMEWYALPF
jgi:nucleoredoxin